MDRQDAKPRRPSLLAGGPEHSAPLPPTARILADMEGQPGNGIGIPGKRRARVLLPALGLLALSGIVVLLLSRTGSDGAAVESEGANASARLDHPAMIVDEGIGQPALAIQPDPDASADQTGAPAANATEASAASSASVEAQPDPRAPDNNPFASGARPAPLTAAGRPRTAKPASTAAAESESESKLLAALLANIQSSPAEREASPLDVLLQDMAAEEKAAGTTAAVGGQSRPTRMRSQQIQSNLRECPPANTAKGLACRQEICAVYAGRDPACPAG